MMKRLHDLFNRSTPSMDEELASMLTKYNKKCTRKDIVDNFIKKLNEDIYNSAKYGNDRLTITHIPTEVIPYLNKIKETLVTKHFQVGLLTEPYPILAIKWNIGVNSIAIQNIK